MQTHEERKKSFKRVAKHCLKNNKGAKLTVRFTFLFY